MQALVLARSEFDELVDQAIPSVARRMLVTLAERFRSERARWEQLHARRLSRPPD
jgi:CelD/BcsL family acetyltransferase involved in cellulose biosynthesis